MRIFLAEDNEDNYLVVKSNIRKLGVEVELLWEKDGQLSINMLRDENSIDLFLLDIEMPNVDGLELAKWIRAQKRFDATPIVAITASVFAEMKQMYLEKGFDYILEKPFTRKDFLNLMNEIINDKVQ